MDNDYGPVNGDYYDRNYYDPDDPGRYWSANVVADVLVSLTTTTIIYTYRTCVLLADSVEIAVQILMMVVRIFIFTPISWMFFIMLLYVGWISFCALVHFYDWYGRANGLLARACFDMLNPLGWYWAAHAGDFAPMLRLLRFMVYALYPLESLWTVCFPLVLDVYLDPDVVRNSTVTVRSLGASRS